MVFTTRPVIMGTHGVVASSHYIATGAGFNILKEGGNAFDSGAAMWFCLTVLKPHLVGVAGESPILLYSNQDEKVMAVNGQGSAPMGATIEWFKEQGYPMIPEDGFTPAVVPAAFDSWLKTLEEYGSLPLQKILEPALEIVRDGFPVYPTLNAFLMREKDRFLEEWPTSANVYLPDNKVPEVGKIIRNPDLYNTFKTIAELAEKSDSRIGGIDSARKHFYDGPIAEKIVEFMQSTTVRDVYGKENHGLITLEDFSKYRARFETPVSIDYMGLDVHKCGPWTQGPVFLQQLRLLEGFDLKEIGHNTVDYLHIWIECAKLAFADREQYYADPDFENVPLERLLSRKYAEERRKLVSLEIASMLHRPGGVDPVRLEEFGKKHWFEGDTVHIDAVDRWGNMISATPSGGWIRTSPLVPGLGFPMGTRAQMMHLDPSHVERLEPGKRPSTTLTPSLVTRNGEQYMVFGTPGGDKQDQWTLQFFLNYTVFDMNIQEALDAPTVHISHFPGSFWPHSVRPGEVNVEPRIPEEVLDGLHKRGHNVALSSPWSHGRCSAIRYDPASGLISGGASPRTGEPYAIGW